MYFHSFELQILIWWVFFKPVFEDFERCAKSIIINMIDINMITGCFEEKLCISGNFRFFWLMKYFRVLIRIKGLIESRLQSHRMEDQRCSLPDPDQVLSSGSDNQEDFLSLVERVQSRRMDEQRASLQSPPTGPAHLQHHPRHQWWRAVCISLNLLDVFM